MINKLVLPFHLVKKYVFNHFFNHYLKALHSAEQKNTLAAIEQDAGLSDTDLILVQQALLKQDLDLFKAGLLKLLSKNCEHACLNHLEQCHALYKGLEPEIILNKNLLKNRINRIQKIHFMAYCQRASSA